MYMNALDASTRMFVKIRTYDLITGANGHGYNHTTYEKNNGIYIAVNQIECIQPKGDRASIWVGDEVIECDLKDAEELVFTFGCADLTHESGQ